MICGPETADVSRGEAEENIGGLGSTNRTVSRGTQSIGIITY